MLQLSCALHEYLGYGESCPLPPPWDFLACPQVVRTPRNPADILEKMSSQYGKEALCATSLVVETESGLQFVSPLHSPGELVLALRNRNGECFDLVTEQGCVSGRAPPLVATLADASTIEEVKKGHKLFVTFSLVDACILRGLGLPAIPGSGLAECASGHLNQVCEVFDLLPILAECPQPSTIAERTDALKHLIEDWPENIDVGKVIFAGWDIASLTLARPEAAKDTIEQWRGYADRFKLDLGKFVVWQPDQEFHESLIGYRDLRSAHALRATLEASLLDDFQPLHPTEDIPQPTQSSNAEVTREAPPRPDGNAGRAMDLVSALAAHFQAKASPGGLFNPNAGSAAGRNVQMAFEREILQPLRRLGAGSPLARNLTETLAGVSRVFHLDAVSLAAKALCAESDSEPALKDEDVRRLGHLVDQVIRLSAVVAATADLNLTTSHNHIETGPSAGDAYEPD